MLEIERKFLVAKDPPIISTGTEIVQSYLGFSPEICLREERPVGSPEDVRRYTLTMKFGNGMSREEFGGPLSPERYARMKTFAKASLSKTRYLVDDYSCPYIATLDDYHGELSGLRVIEVEFLDDDTAKNFIPPDWFGPEITGQEFFSNANLAKLASLGERKEGSVINLRLGRWSQLLAPSYGHCERCGTTWNFVKPHSTYFTPERGCFPLCVECWEELTPEGRVPYYRKLYNRWANHSYWDSSEHDGRDETEFADTWQLIAAAVLSGK